MVMHMIKGPCKEYVTLPTLPGRGGGVKKMTIFDKGRGVEKKSGCVLVIDLVASYTDIECSPVAGIVLEEGLFVKRIVLRGLHLTPK